MMGPRLGRMLCPWLDEPLARLESAAAAGRLGHAWLLSGPAGIGKRNLAYAVALRLLTATSGGKPPDPAGPRDLLAAEAELATADLHPDLHRLAAEEDKRTISVEQVRETTAGLTLKAHIAPCKLVVIEAADTMTTAAANALLKSLEEPTPDTYLFLLADRPGRLLPTILSRCQRLVLRAPAPARVTAWLAGDGLDAGALARAPQPLAPLTAARILIDKDLMNTFNEINDNLKLLHDGRADPLALADRWHKGDTELALSCLIGHLQAAIRQRLVPGHSKPVTDSAGHLADNLTEPATASALLAGLQMAENLREQLGRGTNVELALKSLLLGLEQGDLPRVNW